MEIIKFLIIRGAKISTPMALSGFTVSLVFGLILSITARLNVGNLGNDLSYRVIIMAFVVAVILGILTIIAGVSSWLLDRFYIKGHLLPIYIDGARFAINKGDAPGAKKQIEEGLKLANDNSELLNLQGQMFYLGHDYLSALSSFRDAYKSKKDPRYLYNCSSMLAYLRNFKDSIKYFEEAENDQPPDDRYIISKGVILGYLGRFDEAKELIISVLNKLNKNHIKKDLRAIANFELGIVSLLYNNTVTDESITYFTKSVCLDSGFIQVLSGFTNLLHGDDSENFLVEVDTLKKYINTDIYSKFLENLGRMSIKDFQQIMTA